MEEKRPITILCLASEYKGIPFLYECERQGCRVILVAAQATAEDPWPWDVIDEHFYMPDLSAQPDITYAISYLMRTRSIDRIIALDDYDVATAASLREHLRLPGMGESTARHFRDKLAMRMRAQEAGVLVPAFTPLFNHARVEAYLSQVAPPWVLKPRFEAGAIGIRKLDTSQAVWQALAELGDQQSFYLLEQFVPGDVFHVDSLIWQGEVVFALASGYGVPPLAVAHGGGIFTTQVLPRSDEQTETLLRLNAELVRELGQKRGAMHTEFIRGEDGRFYFLETAARVGGANIDKMVEAATGISLWAEVARLEIADIRQQPYTLPPYRQEYAGLITCLARQKHPDLTAYTDAEIVWRLEKEYHAGLLVASPFADRVTELLTSYTTRFAQDFLAVQPPKQDVRHTI